MYLNGCVFILTDRGSVKVDLTPEREPDPLNSTTIMFRSDQAQNIPFYCNFGPSLVNKNNCFFKQSLTDDTNLVANIEGTPTARTGPPASGFLTQGTTERCTDYNSDC